MSEIAEKAAREIRRHFDEDFDTTIPGEVFDRELVQIVERAIAESQPQPEKHCSCKHPMSSHIGRNSCSERDCKCRLYTELGDGEPSLPPDSKIRQALMTHWLSQIECNHYEKSDSAICACGWKSERGCNVGKAVELWIDHVFLESGAAQEVSPTCPLCKKSNRFMRQPGTCSHPFHDEPFRKMLEEVSPRTYTLIFMFTPDFQKVLLLKKATPEWQKGLWNGPGGIVEAGESEIDGAVRELREESAIALTSQELTSVLKFSCDCERFRIPDCGLHYISVFAGTAPEDVLLAAKGSDIEPVELLPVGGLPGRVDYLPHLLALCAMRLKQPDDNGVEEVSPPSPEPEIDCEVRHVTHGDVRKCLAGDHSECESSTDLVEKLRHAELGEEANAERADHWQGNHAEQVRRKRVQAEILRETRRKLKQAEGDTRELKAALQAIVNWCRHPAHGGKYDLPKPLEPYLLQAEKVLGF